MWIFFFHTCIKILLFQKLLKNCFQLSLSRCSNSSLSVTTGLTSTIKVSTQNVELVHQHSIEKSFFSSLFQNYDSPKFPIHSCFNIDSSGNWNFFLRNQRLEYFRIVKSWTDRCLLVAECLVEKQSLPLFVLKSHLVKNGQRNFSFQILQYSNSYFYSIRN